MSFALRDSGAVIHTVNSHGEGGSPLRRRTPTTYPADGATAASSNRVVAVIDIVSQKDVAMHASEVQTGEVVEDISR
jgi:hypothetical protein